MYCAVYTVLNIEGDLLTPKHSTVQERLAHWRKGIKRVSLREFQRVVNNHLPPHAQVSVGTVRNYELAPGDQTHSPGPRAEFIAALKAAYPDLSLNWLLLGEGPPTEPDRRLEDHLKELIVHAEEGETTVGNLLEEGLKSGFPLYGTVTDALARYDLPFNASSTLQSFLIRVFSSRAESGGSVSVRDVGRYLDREMGPALRGKFLTEGEQMAAILGVLAALYVREFGAAVLVK